jgi:hypothetical protein
VNMTPDWGSKLVNRLIDSLREYITNLPTDGPYEESEKAREMLTECRVRLEQFLWAFNRYGEIRDGKSAWRLPDPSTRPGQG